MQAHRRRQQQQPRQQRTRPLLPLPLLELAPAAAVAAGVAAVVGWGSWRHKTRPEQGFHPYLGTLWLQRLMVTPCRRVRTCCGMIHVPLAARHPHRPLPRRRRRQAAHPPHQLPQQQLLRWAGRQLPSARAVLEEKMVQHRH